MKKILGFIVIIAVFFICSGISVYGEILNGFSKGDIHVLLASTNSLECKGNLKLSETLGNEGDTISVEVVASDVTEKFLGSSSSHNRTAYYNLEGVVKSLIYVDNQEIESNKTLVTLENNDVAVQGRLTFRWKVSAGKTNAGFPMYYYKTCYTEKKVISLNRLDDLIDNKPKDEVTESKGEIIVEGRVLHTELWDERRIKLNRSKNTFWPGEKIILSADVTGDIQPNRISVQIDNTEFCTELHYKNGKWEGVLYNVEMIKQWQGKKKLFEKVIFTAFFNEKKYNDIVEIMIDDDGHWQMHRKE